MTGQAAIGGEPAAALAVGRDLACVRRGRRLFAGLTFALAPGGALLVSGVNGAGKSSLVRIVAGLLRPDAGTVDRPAPIALLAEAAALDPERSVAAALDFWAAIDGAAGAGPRVAAALEDVALASLAEVPVRMLSTGQRRRVAMARVLAAGAPVWLLDEPANGLDAAAVARLEALIARHRAAGGAVLVATHLPVALPGAEHIALETLA